MVEKSVLVCMFYFWENGVLFCVFIWEVIGNFFIICCVIKCCLYQINQQLVVIIEVEMKCYNCIIINSMFVVEVILMLVFYIGIVSIDLLYVK